jgi:CBS-domain-containing membrane protein
LDDAMQCKGWLRLDFVFDQLHQGKAGLESQVDGLRTLPCTTVRPEDSIEHALLQFAQIPDRELIVVSDTGELIGILPLLDVLLASADQPRNS